MTAVAHQSDNIEINDAFASALELMERGEHHLFITGRAGTGKSTLLAYFRANTARNVVVVAPTGVAALNVQGQTIHRFFQFSINVTPEKITSKEIRPRETKVYQKLDTLLIDEASMLRADLLDCIDAFLRLYGPETGTSFGGVRLVFIGDLYQLPPVVTKEEREIFRDFYESPYFFSAGALADNPPYIVELEKIYRQRDPDFVEVLNRIRNNAVGDADIAYLNQRHFPDFEPDNTNFYITLAATNKHADTINAERLAALEGATHVATAEITGDFGREYYPTAPELEYKIGAQIMLLNNDTKGRWVNGSIGAIEESLRDERDREYLAVRLQESDDLVSVYPYTWEVYRFSLKDGAVASEPVGSFRQYPLRLAWAVTIHKSQGMTFDNVIIDLTGGRTFASGQMYVALSRCTTLEGLVLKSPIRKSDIRADYRIHNFLIAREKNSAEADNPLEARIALIEQAIANENRVEMTYLKADNTKQNRLVRPISIVEEHYKGSSFTGMRAFCLLRKDFRVFNVERILDVREK